MNAPKPKTFDYVWVLRCSGTNENRNPECAIIPNVSSKGIKPLVEVVDTEILHRFSRLLRAKYGEVMVDLPYYLLEADNKFSDSISNIFRQYPDQADFFHKNKSMVDIPVVSAQHIGNRDYDSENAIMQRIKGEFEKVAVRVRVPSFNLGMATTIKRSYESLVNNMHKSDLLLLDVFDISGYESQINSNLELMSDIGKKQNINVFVLNAFEPVDTGHNYGPLFSFRYGLDGFGDFATEKRYPQAGGRAAKKIIRYYLWEKFILKEIKRDDYNIAAATLKASRFWSNHSSHISSCSACNDVQHNRFNRGHTFWKKFRVIHYLHCIGNETRLKYSTTSTDQDLDPDGYDILFNVEEE